MNESDTKEVSDVEETPAERQVADLTTPPRNPNTKSVTKAQVADSIVKQLTAPDDSKLRACKGYITRWISQCVQSYSEIYSKYNVVYLMSDRMLMPCDSDMIYQSLSSCDHSKPILLLLQSYGGRIEPAYFIGKMLRQFPDLHVAVPRMAKSAASLICCAASHIHMGGLSELGPIDPQVNGVPALGLKNAIQHLAELTGKYPDATSLFVGYMCKRVEPMDLGYYERVVESSIQYAERLLKRAHSEAQNQNIRSIARRLTYDYKDHGFVIDRQEAGDVFPEGTVCSDTDEYRVSDIVHKEISWIRQLAKSLNHDFSLVGCGVESPQFYPIRRARP